MYEVFLAWHVVVAILIVAGCYWHIVANDGHSSGYETWIVVSMAVWGFDRSSRLVRLALSGLKTAQITVLDNDYIRVVIPDVSASGHAFLYFPALTWRVWENHPFSIASTLVSVQPPLASVRCVNTTDRSSTDPEMQSGLITSTTNYRSDKIGIAGPSDSISTTSKASELDQKSYQAGVTFYIRTQTGLTSLLRNRTSHAVLLEAGYKSGACSLIPANSSPVLVALVGGVGITPALTPLRSHLGRKKLYWGSRSQTLVDDVFSVYGLASLDSEVFVGRRMPVRQILDTELGGNHPEEVCVLVCGPASMVDEVRFEFNDIVRKRPRVVAKLVVESFSW
ncbi:hypothetical protein ANO11243_085190 [Dothideomycetidae sp. 11243]|nr:hypothetical protein ANO11243_085190 [fungal sp. No.11243]